MMTDVLLVNPKSFQGLPSYLPYGILYIAALLRHKGIHVQIYDSNAEERDFAEVLAYLKPKIIGFSVLSGPCISDAVAKSKQAKAVCREARVVWGGVHTTIFPELVLKQEYVDYIIINEGEYPLLELTEKILNHDPAIHSIQNLGYKESGVLHLNDIRPFIQLDDLPLPAWDLVPIEKYIHNKFYSDRVLTLHTSRGCPWSCAYCYNELVNFRRWRGLSAEKVLEQVRYVIEQYKIKGIQFYDDEFDANQKRATKVYELLIQEKIQIKFGHYSRTNIADKERYRLAKAAGCRFIEFGVESGAERILDMLRKKQSLDHIKRAFDICHRVGIKSGAMFMVGMPTETTTDVDKTVELVKSLGAHQAICTIFRPYPGSELFEYCRAQRLFFLPEDLEKQGEAYNIGNTDINVSEVESGALREITNLFQLKNIINEVKACITNKNWHLLKYYFQKLDSKRIYSLLQMSLNVLRSKKFSKNML